MNDQKLKFLFKHNSILALIAFKVVGRFQALWSQMVGPIKWLPTGIKQGRLAKASSKEVKQGC